jgi:thiamine-monophosphate kinase
MNELKLLKNILPGLKQHDDVVVGPGDDCAAIANGDSLMLLAADQLISGIHYLPDTPAEKVAAKLLKRNLSDIAAMGGTPSQALLTIASSRHDETWFMDFYRGLNRVAKQFNISICGGDLAALPTNFAGDGEVLSLSITGQVDPTKICLRSNAANGDLLYCTGCFGNSFATEHHLDFKPRLAEGAWLAGSYTRAAIDVSDGLLLDLERLAEASQLAVILELEKIPLRNGANIAAALKDGEDYELLFAIPEEIAKKLEQEWLFHSTRLTCIGRFTADNCGIVYDNNGKNLSKSENKGYEHNNEK